MDTEKRQNERRTESGIEVKPLYKPDDLEGFDYAERLGDPGEYPYTRGPYPSMYRGRPWTMRQYAGFGTARETNARFKYLIDNGQTGLSVAFDLPTQMGAIPTSSSPPARWARSVWPSTRSWTCAISSRAFPWGRSRPR